MTQQDQDELEAREDIAEMIARKPVIKTTASGFSVTYTLGFFKAHLAKLRKIFAAKAREGGK